MKSLWENTAKRPDFKVLDGDKKTDVLIIGGGMAGVLCAFEMKNRGVDTFRSGKNRYGNNTQHHRQNHLSARIDI